MKVSPSTISVFTHTERERSCCEGKCLACDVALLRSAPNITTYLFSYRFVTSSYCPSRAFNGCVFMYEVIMW